MKFLHTSDWHLGIPLHGKMPFTEDQRYSINKICEIAKEQEVDGILIAGDVFDKSVAGKDALQMYDEFMTKLCVEMEIPVYLIAGNHDGADRISQCKELLEKSGLHVAGVLTDKVQVVRLKDDNVDIYMLPWISTDKVKAVYPDEADEIKSLQDAYEVVLNHYREQFIDGHTNIIISHSYVVGADTCGSDHSAEMGNATLIEDSVYDGFDYVALGHLHSPHNIKHNIRYSGTPMVYSFGKEENQIKTVTIIDTDNLDKEPIEIEVPQLRIRKTLTGTYEELMNADYDDDILNGYVWLKVTDREIGLETRSFFSERYIHFVNAEGLRPELEKSKISMTLEEFEDNKRDPEMIFTQYCADIMGTEPSDHIMSLFMDAVEEYNRRMTQNEAN